MSGNKFEVKYLCPQWGSEEHSASTFLERAVNEGFDGVEINMPGDIAYINEFERALQHVRTTHREDFTFVLQLVPEAADERPDQFLDRIEARLKQLALMKPDFINSHTGKDYFTFEENCRAIDMLSEFSDATSIPVFHEIHRGRFTFHSAGTIPYLEKYPDLKLTADFSHWCTVSESMLQDQQHIMQRVFPHIAHLHARIGFEQGPQVNDPAAPEWQFHCQACMDWWQQIVDHRKAGGFGQLTITPEYGPSPYMPQIPFSQIPLSDQWKNNIDMMRHLKAHLKL